ncbi:hypothetical protein EVB91_112 [Rhizobium phage RHph_I1_18]|nr:hypothetical protein EVB91_112 [Rhizobium phage RHph_I1_18]
MNRIIILAVLLLAGCSKTVQTVDLSQTIVIKPPKTLYNCPVNVKKPDPQTATNKQIADYIKSLRTALNTCKINMEAIQMYVDQAQAQLEKK